MKKNRRFYLGMLLVSIMLCFGTPARAQLVAGVSFDFLGDAAAAITPVFEQIQTGLDEAVKFAKEKVTKIKAKVASYFTKRNNAAEKVPGTKGFAEDSSVDIYDPVAVQAAVNELFLQYPSNDARVNKYYEKEAVEFYYDTMIEAQTAAKKLEGQLNSLRTDIDNFSKDAIAPSGGNAGSSDSSDENGNYYNLYLAHKKFNDVLKVTEEVMALYAQYYVARVIYRRIILPAPYEEEGEEGGALKTSSASSIFRSNMAFAQFLTSSSLDGNSFDGIPFAGGSGCRCCNNGSLDGNSFDGVPFAGGSSCRCRNDGSLDGNSFDGVPFAGGSGCRCRNNGSLDGNSFDGVPFGFRLQMP